LISTLYPIRLHQDVTFSAFKWLLGKANRPNLHASNCHIKTLTPNHTHEIKHCYLFLVFCMYLWMSQIHHCQLSTKNNK
jgi:hypothetical protein